MRVGFVGVFARLVLVAGCLGVTTSRLAAEPITGEESLGMSASKEATKGTSKVSEALALFKSGNYDGSLELWREAAMERPEMPPAPLVMAQLYLQAGMLKQAQASIEQAIQEAPNDPEAYLMEAGLALQRREVDKAESLYKKAQTLAAEFTGAANRKASFPPRIHHGFAGVAEARKDWIGAEAAFQECVKLNPNDIAARQRIAYCRFQRKDENGALEELRKAANANPQMSSPELVLSQFYQWAGDSENAKKWTAKALAARPKDIKIRLALGYNALEQGRLDEASKHAIAAVQVDPKSTDAKMLRGIICVCQKDYVAGELFFDAVLQKSPDDFAVSNNLALALVEQSDEAKSRRALEFAEANIKRFPRSASAASTYGWVLYKVGRLEDAEKALRIAEEAGPVSVDTAYYLARVLVDRDQKAKAKEILEKALRQKGISMCRQEAEDLLAELKK